jgi:hypothetical protein
VSSSVTPPVWKYRGCQVDYGNDHDPERVDMGRRVSRVVETWYSFEGSGEEVSGSTASGCGMQNVKSVLDDKELLGCMSCDNNT